MKYYKNTIIIFLLLSVFVVGTLNFVDTVEAAKWKKYDSGKYTDYYSGAGNKKVAFYQSYIKENKEIYVNIYSYSKKTGKKKLNKIITFSKRNSVIKIDDDDYSWGEISTWQYKTRYSVKTVYKSMMKDIIKESSLHPSKAAFDIQTLKTDNLTLKTYSIQYYSNYIKTFIYSNGTEAGVYSFEKYKNKITIRVWDEKRKMVLDQTTTSNLSLKSTHKMFMKGFAAMIDYDK